MEDTRFKLQELMSLQSTPEVTGPPHHTGHLWRLPSSCKKARLRTQLRAEAEKSLYIERRWEMCERGGEKGKKDCPLVSLIPPVEGSGVSRGRHM